MGKLSDILSAGNGDDIRNLWNSTEAADEFGPLPPGEYVARIIAGELFTGRTNGTPGYKLTFKVLDGDHSGRQFWHDVWLTPAALPMSKRDLGKLGVTALDQLERPLPPGIRCAVKLALRKDDDGTEYNRVRRFEVLGIDKLETDPFAPDYSTAGEGDQADDNGEDGTDDEGGKLEAAGTSQESPQDAAGSAE